MLELVTLTKHSDASRKSNQILFCNYNFTIDFTQQTEFRCLQCTTNREIVSTVPIWFDLTIFRKRFLCALRNILQQKRHFEASHWDSGKLTHFSWYFDEDSSRYPSPNILSNLSVYLDPNDSLQSIIFIAEFFSVHETNLGEQYLSDFIAPRETGVSPT